MTKLPHVTTRECVRACQRAGFTVTRQRGGHIHLHKGGKRITIPLGRITDNIMRELMKNLDVDIEGFRRLVKGK